MSSKINDLGLSMPPPPELKRGVTVVDSTTRKPCTICGNYVPLDNVEACIRYSGGKMLCSDNCREAYVARYGSLPPC